MTIRRSCSLALMAVITACESPSRFAACKALLRRQADAWNRGDLDGFCAGYERSEDTVFVSSPGAKVGWDAMYARYRARYPDRAAMGRLTFSELTFAALGDDAVTARGRWQLVRENDAPWGFFLLVFRKFDDAWKIVLDYTTSGGSPERPRRQIR